MQVQCQDKDSNDDGGDNLQRDSCHHWGAAAKERAELPRYWKNAASPHPALSTLRLTSLSGKGFFFFPLKASVGKWTNNTCKKLGTLAHGCQFLKEDLEIGNVIQFLRKGCHQYKGHSSENGHSCSGCQHRNADSLSDCAHPVFCTGFIRLLSLELF